VENAVPVGGNATKPTWDDLVEKGYYDFLGKVLGSIYKVNDWQCLVGG
jgi:hypothetical protein